jgi:hypothetical protein
MDQLFVSAGWQRTLIERAINEQARVIAHTAAIIRRNGHDLAAALGLHFGAIFRHAPFRSRSAIKLTTKRTLQTQGFKLVVPSA